MRRLIALILCMGILLTGCGFAPKSNSKSLKAEADVADSSDFDTVCKASYENCALNYSGLNDEVLLRQLEDLVYRETVQSLDSDEYVVESVKTVFISKEYIEEVMFNSQTNIYFGYTLDELNNLFQGTRYVFTLGEDGQTTVKELEVIEDNTTETLIKNVAIGTGVILVCVTVSCVTAGIGAPAVSVIFAASAKTGAVMALSSGTLGAVSAGAVRGYETRDMGEALKAAALAGSEGFKWGAISGAVIGGGKEAFTLKAAAKNGLTMNQVAEIQKESQLPIDVISQFHDVKEYQVYNEAKLKPMMVNGRTALVQNIDLNYMSEQADGSLISNFDRMKKGLAPIEPGSGNPYELHHIGQKPDGTLAILSQSQHRGKNIDTILHSKEVKSIVDHGQGWKNTKELFWMGYARNITREVLLG